MAQSHTYESPIGYTVEGKVDEEENVIDLDKNLKLPWWDYTFNASNKYFIHIQFKMSGDNSQKNKWRKYGARRATINGQSAKVISMKNNPNPYDNNEYIKITQKNKEYRLYCLTGIGWMFDDGEGIYKNIKTTNNGKMQ